MQNKNNSRTDSIYDGEHQRNAMEGAPARSAAIDESEAENQKKDLGRDGRVAIDGRVVEVEDGQRESGPRRRWRH